MAIATAVTTRIAADRSIIGGHLREAFRTEKKMASFL